MLDNILAKKNPDELLTKHICNLVDVWKFLRNKLNNFSYLTEEFWKSSLLSILFHDFGKVAQNFQDFNPTSRNYLRHEFLSGSYLLALNVHYYENNPLIIWAIFSHHKPLNDNLFSKDTDKKIIINEQDIVELFSFIENTYKENFQDTFPYNSNAKLYLLYVNSNALYEYFRNKFFQTLKNITKEDRKKYIFYKAILNESDWIASSHQFFLNDLTYDLRYLKSSIVRNLILQEKIKHISEFKFRKFQLKSNTINNVIARAPTGSGKTEAALIWASNKTANSRIFYLLPTKVTSNAIYSRLKNYFGENNIAIVHSSAFLLQKEEQKDNYKYFDYLRDKTFFKNINVCTIDQILTQGFNLGYWELKTFHQLNSKIIIDEIHLYDTYTLGLIISTIEYLKKEFGATFYIMSATMPEKLKQLLTKTLETNKTEFIFDEEYLYTARNQFITTNKKIDELFHSIIRNVRIGKKVLCVVNSVNEAIRIYDKLKIELSTFNVMCYHSRHIVKDRLLKEKTLTEWENFATTKGCLLIATQVVEVSLDIDYDILYTENAPIDALVQRAGRVNRQRKKRKTKIVVFPHNEITSKYVYKSKNILEKSFLLLQENNGKRLTEKDLINLVDRIYEDINIEEVPDYIEGRSSYSNIQKRYDFIKDVTTKEEIFTRKGIDTIEVIPIEFIELLSTASKLEKAKYCVSIQKSRLNIIRKEYDKDKFIYIHTKYTYEKGLEFIENSETIEFF